MDNLFWNLRGGCIFINDPKSIRDALNNGFVRLTEDEKMRFKAGSYHPAHDQGMVPQQVIIAPVQQPQEIVQTFRIIPL